MNYPSSNISPLIVSSQINLTNSQSVSATCSLFTHSGPHHKKDILELILTDKPLKQILQKICLRIESKLNNGSLCSIMLFGVKKGYLQLASAPSFPASIIEQLDKVDIDITQWPCAQSAVTGSLFIIDNIHQHAQFQHMPAQMLKLGLTSCWSMPIKNSMNQILGTVEIHHINPRKPSEEEQIILLDAMRFITIAIDKSNMIQHLAVSEDRYRSVVNTLTEGIMMIAPGGKIITCNPSAQKILKITDMNSVGRRHRYFNRLLRQDGSSIPFGEDPASQVIKSGKAITNIPLGIELYDGSVVWLIVNAQPIHHANLHVEDALNFISNINNTHDNPATSENATTSAAAKKSLKNQSKNTLDAVLISFTDTTKERAAEHQLQYLATHDTLTNLPNRRHFQQRLAHSLSHAENQKVALFFLDLDHFKNVNDTAGHSAGDTLLCEVAKRLSSCVRSDDLLARLGGDEFVVVAESFDDMQHLKELADRLLAQMREPFFIDQHQYYLGSSIGISIYPEDGTDGITLLKCADAAMYQAKQLGRNNYQFYTSELMVRAQHRYTLENNMRKALAENEFVVFYQPKVSMDSSQIVGAEALVRWKMAGFDHLITPNDFIPFAEEIGLILPIGRLILSQACKQAQQWRTSFSPDFVISVNISPRQFLDIDLPQFIQSVLTDTGLPAKALQLEITEGLLMGEADHFMATFNAIINLGVSISLDDFGTGFSSLSYLQRFPIDNIKIDRSFINKIPENRDSIVLTRAIIAMASALCMTVTAEGVENQAQMDFLKEAGCDEIQGHFFSKAVSDLDFEKMLKI